MRDRESAEAFCRRWLAAWTGNRPQALVEFYAEDCYYQDPGRPEGLRGHAQLRPYFDKLLARFPDWVWEPVEVFPNQRGFCLKWQATIPMGSERRTAVGLDIVEVADGKITRNEVYFDPAVLRPNSAPRSQ